MNEPSSIGTFDEERALSFASAEILNDLLPEAGFAVPTRFYQFFLWGAWRTRRVDEAAGHEA